MVVSSRKRWEIELPNPTQKQAPEPSPLYATFNWGWTSISQDKADKELHVAPLDRRHVSCGKIARVVRLERVAGRVNTRRVERNLVYPTCLTCKLRLIPIIIG